MVLLAIETSCDDTSVAIVENGIPLSNVVSSQLVHQKYGGVVPEMASREHQKNILYVAEAALQKAGFKMNQMNAIAFTQGPGLPGSLMVGANFAKGLALGLQKPLIAVNHMEAHILSLLIGNHIPSFPFLCLVVSGGHTMLVLVKKWNDMSILGTTKDDAVGEAFDKCAKILGLGYPGGKQIDDLAKTGNPNKFPFPTGHLSGYDFSYSGVKTAFLYFVQNKEKEWLEKEKPNICASIQQALLKPLIEKLKNAIAETGVNQIGMAGGVAANSSLRLQIQNLGREMNCEVYIPDFQYCTDNAGMIGKAATFKLEQKAFCYLQTVTEPRLKIGQDN
jgi:N6-L-threonylcarbamoyladenine synthase